MADKSCCFLCLKYLMIACLALSMAIELCFVSVYIIQPVAIVKVVEEIHEHRDSRGSRAPWTSMDNSGNTWSRNDTHFRIHFNAASGTGSAARKSDTMTCAEAHSLLLPVFLIVTFDLLVSGVGMYGLFMSHLPIVIAMAAYALLAMIASLFLGQPGAYLLWFVMLAVHAHQIRTNQCEEELRHLQANMAAASYASPAVGVNYGQKGIYCG